MLDEAAEYVYKRQFFMQLETGDYSSRTTMTNLRKTIEDQLGVDGVYDGVDTVYVDHNLLLLVLQEALSNARKYRDRSVPIHIWAELAAPDPAASDRAEHRLLLKVSNANQMGLPALTSEECKQVFRAGVKGHSHNPMSDGLGLDNAAVAIQAARGRVWLSTTSDGGVDYTHFHLDMPVRLASAASSTPSIGPAVLGELASPAAVQPTTVPAQQTVPSSDTGAGESDTETVAREPKGLVCVGLDDTAMLRKMHGLLFRSFVGADMRRSGSLGGTREEIELFVDVVMGRRDLHLEPADLSPVDVAVIDQNLCNDDRGEFLVKGEDICGQLRADGFVGVTCVLTGSNRTEVNRLSELPQIQLVFAKDTDLRIMAEQILKLARHDLRAPTVSKPSARSPLLRQQESAPAASAAAEPAAAGRTVRRDASRRQRPADTTARDR
jgi:hypothetical protein